MTRVVSKTKAKKVSRTSPLPAEAKDPSVELTQAVGTNLRRLRGRRGHSLEQLATLSGVSRSMLGQIELGQSAPTINVLWKIARALDVPFSALLAESGRSGTRILRVQDTKRLLSADRSFESRALFPFDVPRRVEFYELRLAAGAIERASAHAPGTTENLVVSHGALDLAVGEEKHSLSAGDSIVFEADVTHSYRNPGTNETVMYLVMTYADEVHV